MQQSRAIDRAEADGEVVLRLGAPRVPVPILPAEEIRYKYAIDS
jgi:hypothetical protein